METISVDPRDIALSFVKALVLDLNKHTQAARAFNLLPGVPWYLREQIRTIEGKLDGAIDFCIEVTSRLGTAEAEAYLEEEWGE